MIALLSKARWKYAPHIYVLVMLAWLVYVALSLVAGASAPNPYHLSHDSLYLIDLTIFVPVLAIWLMAARGAIHLTSYARLIYKSPEGQGLQQIAVGVMVLLAYLVMIGLLGSIVSYFHASSYIKPLVILKNQMPAGLALIAFLYLYLGSVSLCRSSKAEVQSRDKVLPTGLFLLAAAAIAWGFSGSDTDSLMQANGTPLYVAPHNLLLFTLVMPYLFSWLLGLHASLNILDYAQNVNGTLYRAALGSLAKGIMTTVIFIVALQLFTVGTPIISQLNLGGILLVVYAIILLYGVGAYYITAGSRKLTLIEVAE